MSQLLFNYEVLLYLSSSVKLSSSLKVFNKILTLASSGGAASTDYSQWQSVYLSTAGVSQTHTTYT